MKCKKIAVNPDFLLLCNINKIKKSFFYFAELVQIGTFTSIKPNYSN